jgi:hypothetical protein
MDKQIFQLGPRSNAENVCRRRVQKLIQRVTRGTITLRTAKECVVITGVVCTAIATGGILPWP